MNTVQPTKHRNTPIPGNKSDCCFFTNYTLSLSFSLVKIPNQRITPPSDSIQSEQSSVSLKPPQHITNTSSNPVTEYPLPGVPHSLTSNSLSLLHCFSVPGGLWLEDINTTRYQHLSFLPFQMAPGDFEGKRFIWLPHLDQSCKFSRC